MNKFKEDPLRTLSRTYRWQIVYRQAKEIGGIQLFRNQTDFSEMQIRFLQYLEEINSLYMDLAMGEELISEETIKDQIRADAYLTYRRETRNKTNKKEDSNIVKRIILIPTGEGKKSHGR